MVVLVSYSALEFWLSGTKHFIHDRFSVRNRDLVRLSKGFPVEFDSLFLQGLVDEYGFSLPVRLAVNKASERRDSKMCNCKIINAQSPEAVFVKVDKTVFVACPELCFLQMALEVSIPRLVEIGNNLCAQYQINDNAQFLQSGRLPLTDANLLKEFLQAADGARGIKIARRGVQFVLNGSNSPMESKLAVLIMLPLSLGGYRLKMPVLNAYAKLSDEAKKLLGRETCCCDIVWEEEKVILEYDSNLSHLDRNQHSYDKRKYTALTMSGYKVFSVTADQLRSFDSVERLFDSVRKALHLPSRPKEMSQYAELRYQTVKELLFSNWFTY